jgi:AraC family ethanolamine operon transcriptional activator
MTPFADGAIVSGGFADFDALAEATADWELRFSKLGGGAFSGHVALASTAEIQIAQESWSSGLLIEGAHPPGAVALAMIVEAPEGGVRWNGAGIPHGAMVFGGARGHQVNLITLDAAEITTLCVEEGLFARHFRTRFGFEAGELGRDLALSVEPGGASARDRGLALGVLRLALARGQAASPVSRQKLNQAAVEIALDGLAAGRPTGPAPSRVRQLVARAAEELLRSRLDDPPSLAELALSVGSSERTLHLAFGERFGVPPKRYLRLLRLNAARRRLGRASGSVTEVAAELGFFHFARFAGEYFDLFAELPSATLAAARMRMGARAATYPPG